LLRSSSMREPRYPLPRVVWIKIASLHEVCSASRAQPRARQYQFSLTPSAPWVLLRPLSFGKVGGLARVEPRAGWMTCSRSVLFKGHDNDPSAGSPTETLLRLLLPLNDKVQWTSRDVGGGEPPPSPRSEHFTGPFNR
jgi:hypothetical protein